MNLGAELRNFIKARKLGRVFGSDAGVRLERDRTQCPSLTLHMVQLEGCLQAHEQRSSMKRSPIWLWRLHPRGIVIGKSMARP